MRYQLASSPVHVSFDIDVVDPSLAPGTGTAVPQGLTKHDLLPLLRALGLLNIVCLDLVEVNPSLDDGTKTAQLAAAIAVDALEGTVAQTARVLGVESV